MRHIRSFRIGIAALYAKRQHCARAKPFSLALRARG